MEPSGNESLRTQRGTARKVPRQQTRLAKPGAGPTPRNNNRHKSRIDDKIKKRMSTRYADLPSPTEAAPPMPNMMQGMMEARGEDEQVKERAGALGQSRVDDNKILDDVNFDPDVYLKSKLANSTEAQLKTLQTSLRDAKDDTSVDLQRNVFKNYAQFVMISKEVVTLENDLLELKESLSEFKSMPSLLHIPDPSSAPSSTLSTYKRSSVADLRIMYFNQMQTLHAQIEGSAKFAPTTPGRHVVGEVDGVLALNAATYKVIGKVKFVILDDAVLVARRRRRTAGNEGSRGEGGGDGKLVAERCWPLSEMLVLDTKDSASMTNVFKIRHGRETHVYRTESSADKKSMLQQLRVTAEELAAKKRKEREGEHERRKSMWQGGEGSSMPPLPDWMDFAHRLETPNSADAKQKGELDNNWINEWADDLTVAISLKEWNRATSLVEEGKKKLSMMPTLATKLQPLAAELSSSLLQSLSLPSNRKSTVISLTNLLIRLQAGPAAQNTFLTMRSQVIKNLMRKIRFEGHVGAYIGDLAVVYFTGIKHTADWYLESFKENEAASTFIDWAKKEILEYSQMFRKQVYTADVDPKVVEGAKEITLSQSKRLLEQFGLDFRFLLDDQLSPNPKPQVAAVVPFTIQAKRHVPPALNLPSQNTNATLSASISSSSRKSPAPRSTTPTSAKPSARMIPPSLLSAGPKSDYSASFSSATPPASAFLSSFHVDTPSTSGARNRSAVPSPLLGLNGPMSAPSSAAPPLLSPAPLKSPPPSASSLRPLAPGNGGFSSSLAGSTRERPARSRQPASPSPAAPPPRSMNRPGSVSGQRPPPVAVPQREGMF